MKQIMRADEPANRAQANKQTGDTVTLCGRYHGELAQQLSAADHHLAGRQAL